MYVDRKAKGETHRSVAMLSILYWCLRNRTARMLRPTPSSISTNQTPPLDHITTPSRGTCPLQYAANLPSTKVVTTSLDIDNQATASTFALVRGPNTPRPPSPAPAQLSR